MCLEHSMLRKNGVTNSSVVKCPPSNWKVGCAIHSHWVNCRSAPWARVFTSTAPARRKIQASVCRQLPSPRIKKAICDWYTQTGFFLRFRFGDRKEILRDRLEEFGRPFSIDVISGHYILRDRWRNLRDRFGPSKHLKKTLHANTAACMINY